MWRGWRVTEAAGEKGDGAKIVMGDGEGFWNGDGAAMVER